MILMSIPVYGADIMVQKERARREKERAAHKRTALTRFKILKVPPELAGLKFVMDEISSYQQQLKDATKKVDAAPKTTARE